MVPRKITERFPHRRIDIIESPLGPYAEIVITGGDQYFALGDRVAWMQKETEGGNPDGMVSITGEVLPEKSFPGFESAVDEPDLGVGTNRKRREPALRIQ